MSLPFTTVRSTQPRRGAEVLLEVLESEGVEYIFGNPGTTELPLMDALLNFPQIRYILGLQEASVVAMADGYAQAAHRAGFLNLHTAGGLGHGMGNLLNANVSQTPLVVTAGQQDTRHSVNDPLLFDDLVKIATPAVKWAREVTHVEQIPMLVRRAFHDSNAAPTGPVFLSLPMDVMEQSSTVDAGVHSNISLDFTAGSLHELAQQLAAVAPGKLALVAGDELYHSEAAAETVAVAELLGAPVYGSSWPSRIGFSTAHPLWAGNLPTKATDIAQLLSHYDAVFALGGKSVITILYSEGSAIPRGCDIFQLSSDARDLGRTYDTRLSAVGNIKQSLRAMEPLLEALTKDRREEYRRVRDAVEARLSERRKELVTRAESERGEPVISPLVAAYEVVKAIGPKVAIVDEALATCHQVRALLHSSSPSQYSFLRGGALGWGMPAAVGCSLGLGRDKVACLVGDGAALYSPQALWTAAHEKLPVVFVVMNNREYNILKNFMRSQADYVSAKTDTFIAMDLNEPAIDYVALAKSFGVPAWSIDKAEEIASHIEMALRLDGPSLLEISIRA